MRFTCACTAWKQYVDNKFNIIAIMLYIIFSRLPFDLNLRNSYLVQFHHLLIFLSWSWKLQKFCFCVFWIIFIAIFFPQCFIIFSLAVWILIVIQVSLSKKKTWSTKSPSGLNVILCLRHSGLPALAVWFDTLVKNLRAVFFFIFYLAHDFEGFVLLCDISIFLPISLIYFFGG